MRCIICKLNSKNPACSTNGCAHRFEEEKKEKLKQTPVEKWLPYCPFCSNRILPPKTFLDEETGQVIITAGISRPCQCIGDNELCCMCLVCRKHIHIDKRPPVRKE